MRFPALRVLISLFALLCSRPAFADSFSFSYVFGSTDMTLSGTFTGTQNGQYVEDISDFALLVDGMPLSVPFAARFDDATFSWLPGPVISFDVLLNNFAFADADLVVGDPAGTYFYITPGFGAFFFNADLGAGADGSHEGAWSLKNLSTSPVPDHGLTAGMLLLALAGLRLLRRSTAG